MFSFIREKGWMFYLPLTVIYSELALKLWCFGTVAFNELVFTLLFSLAMAVLFTLLCSIKGGAFFRWAMTAVQVLFFLLCGAQAVYYRIFKSFLVLFSIKSAGMVIGNFWREALQGIWNTAPMLLILLVPVALWIIFGKKLSPAAPTGRQRWRALALAVLLQVCGVLVVKSSTSGVMSAEYLYYESFVPELSIRYFGAVTTLQQDIVWTFFPDGPEAEVQGVLESLAPSAAPSASPSPSPAPAAETPVQTPEPVIDTSPNVLEIDFSSLIADSSGVVQELHQYFSQARPSNKNEYTGMFKGKNLIWVCAEGFSSFAMDEQHTPTLWKMANEGFVFKNFYNPVWFVSTSDGEYTLLTSMLPKSGVWSMYQSWDNTMPFGMGNLLNPLGYSSYAFHDHTYDYYNRDKSHPNLGYEYYARYAGLDVTDTWPPSDVEMIQNSRDFYMDSTPFNVYYMTVSGHMYYNFYGNQMSVKHEDEVADLPYGEGARAYIASEMETDQAMELLIQQLDEAGVLEDTVIVLSGDHYPYGLEIPDIEELYGGTIDQNFELYHSTLIIWSASMEEPVPVDKLCCAVDVMPTICNLFGLDYDSRLVMGRDILSDSPGMVVFNNRSYMTELGRYNAANDTFEPTNPGDWASDDAMWAYAREKLDVVEDMFSVSANVLDYDYYSYIFPDEE